MNPLETKLYKALIALRAILCDPDGNPCFKGSQGDKDIAKESFKAIDHYEFYDGIEAVKKANK